MDERRIVLAFDPDLGEIAALTEGQRTSVVLFRLHNTGTANVIRRFSSVLLDAADALEEGAVVVVEEWRHRIRELPIRRPGPSG